MAVQAQSIDDTAATLRAPVESSKLQFIHTEGLDANAETRSAFNANQPLVREPARELPEEPPPLRTIDLTTPPDDLLQRIRNGFGMPDLASPLVTERQAWYLNHPNALKITLNRARRYLFHIVAELEKRGMPTELALLPIIESSYNPMALSPAHASGIWQFIPSTGKNYRLQQNWWQDERRDVLASTDAALNYLQTIYEMQGDWHLALASYNWGESAVQRAVAKNLARHLPTDYAHLTMPAETRYYVPKLQAVKNIIAQPALFGIQLDPIPNQAYFESIDRTTNMDVHVAAKLAETPLDEFLALNPSYNRPVMPADKDGQIVLPANKVQTFLNNLQLYEDQDKPLSNWRSYTLKKGERLDKVAARFGLNVARLKQINGMNGRTKLGPGSTLLVPNQESASSDDRLDTDPPPQTTASPRNKAKKSGKATSSSSRTQRISKPKSSPADQATRVQAKTKDTAKDKNPRKSGESAKTKKQTRKVEKTEKAASKSPSKTKGKTKQSAQANKKGR